MKMYLYGMRVRPFMPATFPKEGFERCLEEDEITKEILNNCERQYFDILAYNTPLSEETLKDYQMNFIMEL